MKHYVYQITNLLNGKYYRGKHSAESLDNDYMGSGRLIRAAIKKYGIENFKKIILRTFPTSDAAYEYEAEVVTMKEVNDPMCYNLMPGGKGGQKIYSDEELKEHRLKYHQQPGVKESKKESDRKYYQQNKEETKERQRKHYQQNKEQIKESQRKHYQQNKEEILEHHRGYYQHNKEEWYKYRQQPKEKERRRKYMREYSQRKKAEKSR